MVPGFNVSVGYSQTFGGKQRLNGLEDGAETSARQIRLDFIAVPADNIFLALQFCRDMVTDGGFREALRVSTRISYIF